MVPKDAYGLFAALAESYCQLVESGQVGSPDFLGGVRKILLETYAAAVALPPVTDAPHEVRPEKKSIREQRRAIFGRLRLELPIDVYRCIFNPLQLEQEPVVGSLADDLADIWGDLKPGLQALRELPAELQPDVWWEWKFAFESHWGRHAMDALRVLHEAGTDS